MAKMDYSGTFGGALDEYYDRQPAEYEKRISDDEDPEEEHWRDGPDEDDNR